MGLFKSMFGGGKSPPPPRTIESPNDLKPGDMLKMEYTEQTLISGQTLKVTEQVFYDIGAIEQCKTVSITEGADQRVLLSTSTVNSDRQLEVAIAVLPEKVFELFNRDQFVAIFEQPDNTDHRIKRTGKSDETQGFLGESYFQERTNEAYRSKKDCREGSMLDSDLTAFDYKLMVTDDRHHAVRIEVYDGGRTDVYLIAYLPLNKVEEYWPAH
jgi:hypothetical protein